MVKVADKENELTWPIFQNLTSIYLLCIQSVLRNVFLKTEKRECKDLEFYELMGRADVGM